MTVPEFFLVVITYLDGSKESLRASSISVNRWFLELNIEVWGVNTEGESVKIHTMHRGSWPLSSIRKWLIVKEQ